MRLISPEPTVKVVLSKKVYNIHIEQLCSTCSPGLIKMGGKIYSTFSFPEVGNIKFLSLI